MMVDADDEATVPVPSAIKSLAKIHQLPPFTKMYVSERVVVIAVPKLDGCRWRAALGLLPFDGDGETEGFWMGDKIRLVKL